MSGGSVARTRKSTRTLPHLILALFPLIWPEVSSWVMAALLYPRCSASAGVMDVIFGLAATSRPAQSSRAGAQRLTRAAHWAVPVGNLSPRTIIRGAS